jgi:hypothetical protein
MSFIKKYRDYVRDNPEGYWFKRKLYGWGWTPVRWQGWAVLAAVIAVYIWILAPFVSGPEPSREGLYLFIFKIFAWMTALITICWLTGETPKWQWGIPEKPEQR